MWYTQKIGTVHYTCFLFKNSFDYHLMCDIHTKKECLYALVSIWYLKLLWKGCILYFNVCCTQTFMVFKFLDQYKMECILYTDNNGSLISDQYKKWTIFVIETEHLLSQTLDYIYNIYWNILFWDGLLMI